MGDLGALIDEPENEASLAKFFDQALAQIGDRYGFAEATADDDDPDAFDCSELVEWAANRAGAAVPDGSWRQYLELKAAGSVVSVERALQTPGALLFEFSSEPQPGRIPSTRNVAISLGDGRVLEANASAGVVRIAPAGDRFDYAGVIPAFADQASPELASALRERVVMLESGKTLEGLGSIEDQLAVRGATIWDRDADGVPDYYEKEVPHLDESLPDSDGDGVGDRDEYILDKAFFRGGLDRDGDGLTDKAEAKLGTDAGLADTDSDGLSDFVEVQIDSDPHTPTVRTGGSTREDVVIPPDAEREVEEMLRLQQTAEIARDHLMDTLRRETDGQSGADAPPADESKSETSSSAPLAEPPDSVAGDTPGDADGDGVPTQLEVELGRDPTKRDSDADGVRDDDELIWDRAVKPQGGAGGVQDTDGDGILDRAEIGLGTNPQRFDTDGDGLSDLHELRTGTDPGVSNATAPAPSTPVPEPSADPVMDQLVDRIMTATNALMVDETAPVTPEAPTSEEQIADDRPAETFVEPAPSPDGLDASP